MNPKYNITKAVLTSMGLPSDDERVKKTIPVWWYSTRDKATGGLRLTEQGFDALKSADIKYYDIRPDDPIAITNELIVWIDQNIDCPFFITKKRIWVFGERMAVQLVLFSGNIAKLHRSKKRFSEKHQTS